MKLIRLTVTDYKRVELADITLAPDASGVVALMGPNESGKSSTLDAFEAILAGRAAPKRRMPVRAGQDQARIVGEFLTDDGATITVTRRYKASGGTDIVVTQDGMRVAAPDQILRALYSHIALDPLAFANLGSKEQAETLIRLIGVDPAPLDEERANAYTTRTDVNREVKRLEAVVAGYGPEDPALAARQPVSVADLSEQAAAITARNNEIDEAKREEQHATEEARMLTIEINQLIERRKAANARADEANALIERLGDYQDAAPIREQIRTAEATNDAIRHQQDRAFQANALAEQRERSERLTAIIADVDARKAEAFASAEWPVDGLDIVDGEVYLDGTPFAETSAGRKLRTSTAIAMALNPTLRAIVIRDGSLLDESNRQIVHDIAQQHDFTVLMEIVDRNADNGVVFSEGRIEDRVGGVA